MLRPGSDASGFVPTEAAAPEEYREASGTLVTMSLDDKRMSQFINCTGYAPDSSRTMTTPTNPRIDDTDGDPTSRQASMPMAIAIEGDFRNLVKLLARAVESIGNTDEELALRLNRTKEVAERGLRLSKLVTELARAQKF